MFTGRRIGDGGAFWRVADVGSPADGQHRDRCASGSAPAGRAMGSGHVLRLARGAPGGSVGGRAAGVRGGAGRGPPFDPLALIVRPGDGNGPWLADVGFGSHSDYPLLLEARDDQDDPAGRFRLADAGAGDIDVLKDGRPQYRIETRERSLADCVPTCWWPHTSPLPPFPPRPTR